MPELYRLIDDVRRRHALVVAAFGHAGDGNIHVNLMVDPDDAGEMARATAAEHDLFTGVVALDGDEALSLGEYPTALYAWATRERGIGYKSYRALRDGNWSLPHGDIVGPVPNKLRKSVRDYGEKLNGRKPRFPQDTGYTVRKRKAPYLP